MPGARILPDRGDQPLELGRGARRDGRGAAHEVEQFGRRQPGPVADMGEEVSRRHDGPRGVAHVLGDHLGVVATAAPQIGDQLLVGERVGIDCLQLPVRPDRGRLDGLVPVLELLAPEFLPEDLLRPLESHRNLLRRNRMHGHVGEAVDVLVLERVDHHPVEAGEVLNAAPERLGMGFGPVARHGPGKVDGIELPRTGARRLETKLGRSLRWVHLKSSLAAEPLCFDLCAVPMRFWAPAATGAHRPSL